MQIMQSNVQFSGANTQAAKADIPEPESLTKAREEAFAARRELDQAVLDEAKLVSGKREQAENASSARTNLENMLIYNDSGKLKKSAEKVASRIEKTQEKVKDLARQASGLEASMAETKESLAGELISEDRKIQKARVKVLQRDIDKNEKAQDDNAKTLKSQQAEQNRLAALLSDVESRWNENLQHLSESERTGFAERLEAREAGGRYKKADKKDGPSLMERVQDIKGKFSKDDAEKAEDPLEDLRDKLYDARKALVDEVIAHNEKVEEAQAELDAEAAVLPQAKPEPTGLKKFVAAVKKYIKEPIY